MQLIYNSLKYSTGVHFIETNSIFISQYNDPCNSHQHYWNTPHANLNARDNLKHLIFFYKFKIVDELRLLAFRRSKTLVKMLSCICYCKIYDFCGPTEEIPDLKYTHWPMKFQWPLLHILFYSALPLYFNMFLTSAVCDKGQPKLCSADM